MLRLGKLFDKGIIRMRIVTPELKQSMKILEQTPSFDDDDDDNKEGDDNEEGMEKPKEALNPAFETELVQFPQPRWSNSMATAE